MYSYLLKYVFIDLKEYFKKLFLKMALTQRKKTAFVLIKSVFHSDNMWKSCEVQLMSDAPAS